MHADERVDLLDCVLRYAHTLPSWCIWLRLIGACYEVLSCSLCPGFHHGGVSDLWGVGGFNTRPDAINRTESAGKGDGHVSRGVVPECIISVMPEGG